MVDNNKNNAARVALFAFEAAYRVCFMVAILAIIIILMPLVDKVPPEYYFSMPIIGSLFLFFCTAPLGNSHLGADLRGLICWAIVVEVFYAVIYSFDALLPIYRAIRLQFNYIDFGFLCALILRCMWVVRDDAGLPLSYPKFEFVRQLVGGKSSHALLTTEQKITGYAMIALSFVIGAILQWYKIWFLVPAFVAFFAIVVLQILRAEEVNYKDLLDSVGG